MITLSQGRYRAAAQQSSSVVCHSSSLSVTIHSSFCFWLLLPLCYHQCLFNHTVRWAAETTQLKAAVYFRLVWPHGHPSTTAGTRGQPGIRLEGADSSSRQQHLLRLIWSNRLNATQVPQVDIQTWILLGLHRKTQSLNTKSRKNRNSWKQTCKAKNMRLP